MELPGDYKKRMKEGDVGTARKVVKQQASRGIFGLLKRFFTKPLLD
jgi:hypothetical protein